MSGQDHIEHLKRDYVHRKAWYYSLMLGGCSLLAGAVYGRWQPGTPGALFLLGLWLATAFLLLRAFRRAQAISLLTLSRHLNRTQATLEESAHLVLVPAAQRSSLEQLQVGRISPALAALKGPQALPLSFKPAGGLLLACVALSALVYWVPLPVPTGVGPVPATGPALAARQLRALQQVLPAIKSVAIRVTPPAYTGRAPYAAGGTSFKAEAGARLTWRLHTAGDIRHLQLSIREKQHLAFHALAGEPHTYEASVTAPASFIYTLDVNGRKSDFYAVEVIPDQAPVVTIRQPRPYTAIAFGEPQQLTVVASLADDYGLRKAMLTATVAKGGGEAVKFTEKTFSLRPAVPSRPDQWSVRQQLNLKALGMSYGDELYFFVQAQDNHGATVRSETYLVQLEDTTVVTGGTDLSLPVTVVPAYFRSQRQLIIDTEKLLQEKKGLPAADFQARSQDLAGEQKILRLRYGKFLGEEATTTIGPGAAEAATHSAGDGHDHGPPPAGASTTEQLLDPYLHKHDTEEDASFFEPKVKAQLKAALSQMWSAELQLHLGQPAAALPYEYKALRLLKEVQQQSRAYVRKMGFDAPPIREQEKRLSGELDKIAAPSTQAQRPEKQSYPAIRQALSWLGRQHAGTRPAPREAQVLQRAGEELARVALQQPGRYLRALQHLRQLTAEVQAGSIGCSACLTSVRGALEQVLPPPDPALAPATRHRQGLAEQYFKRLK